MELTVLDPETIPKEVHVFPWDGRQGIFGSRTDLFRENCGLPYVLEKALEGETEEVVDLSVASIGCSYGAEIDSFLSLAELSPRIGKVSILGMDFNPEVLELAKQGTHLSRPLTWAEGERVSEQLTESGFEVTPFKVQTDDDSFKRHSALVIDSTELRRKHDVRFELGDISQMLSEHEEFDIVFANNILYWLSDADLRIAPYNLAYLARRRGSIISVGTAMARECSQVFSPVMLSQGFDFCGVPNPDDEIIKMYRNRGDLHAQTRFDV